MDLTNSEISSRGYVYLSLLKNYGDLKSKYKVIY